MTRTGHRAARGARADDGRPPKVDAGAPTAAAAGPRAVVRVYATTSKPGTPRGVGLPRGGGLCGCPITRVAPRAGRRWPGGGAELALPPERAATGGSRAGALRRRQARSRCGSASSRTDLAGRSSARARRRPIRLVARPRRRPVRGRGRARAAHPEPNDVDGDEVRNEVDNCPNDRNGSQLDTDGRPGGTGRRAATPTTTTTACRTRRRQLPRGREPGPGRRRRRRLRRRLPAGRRRRRRRRSTATTTATSPPTPTRPTSTATTGATSATRDRDGDRFDDEFDNCPTVYNLEPNDVDGDGPDRRPARRRRRRHRHGVRPGRAGDRPPPPRRPPPAPAAADASAAADRRRRPPLPAWPRSRAGLVVRLRCSEACAGTAELAVGRARRAAAAPRRSRVLAARLGAAGRRAAPPTRSCASARPPAGALARARRACARRCTAIAVEPSGNRARRSRRIALPTLTAMTPRVVCPFAHEA